MRIGNWPLFMLAVEYIIRHPEHHMQHKWRSPCGTFRCLAGWIAFFGGYRDVFEDGPRDRFVGVRLEGLTAESDILSVEEAALKALELDPEIYGEAADTSERDWSMDEFANALFSGSLDLADILAVVRDLAKADGVTPTPIIVDEMVLCGIVSKENGF
jgi:hypothetical protein